MRRGRHCQSRFLQWPWPTSTGGESMSRALLAATFALLTAMPAHAAPPQGKVGEAIERGAKYLKSVYANGGGGGDATHGTGPSSLAGLALLEAGTPPTDSAVQRIAGIVRDRSPGEDGTYQNALALLFLDRLGESADAARIQLLGTRLYLGMLSSGGFGYQLPALPAGAAPAETKSQRKKPDNGFLPVKPKGNGPVADNSLDTLSPEVVPVFRAARQLLRAGGRAGGEGDNSNTQFGLIALWVAKRRGVPVDDALALVGRRFLVTQNAADGGWGYTPNSNSSPPMTCAGLLGLAVGTRAEAPPPAAQGRPRRRPVLQPARRQGEARQAGGRARRRGDAGGPHPARAHGRHRAGAGAQSPVGSRRRVLPALVARARRRGAGSRHARRGRLARLGLRLHPPLATGRRLVEWHVRYGSLDFVRHAVPVAGELHQRFD